MTTKQTLENYFHTLAEKGAWQTFLSEGISFVSHTIPAKEVTGKEAYVESTRGFYSMIQSFEVKRLIVDGERACALTSYQLKPPHGAPFTCDVAELFSVKDQKIDSFEIYFDSAPFAVPARP